MPTQSGTRKEPIRSQHLQDAALMPVALKHTQHNTWVLTGVVCTAGETEQLGPRPWARAVCGTPRPFCWDKTQCHKYEKGEVDTPHHPAAYLIQEHGALHSKLPPQHWFEHCMRMGPLSSKEYYFWPCKGKGHASRTQPNIMQPDQIRVPLLESGAEDSNPQSGTSGGDPSWGPAHLLEA